MSLQPLDELNRLVEGGNDLLKYQRKEGRDMASARCAPRQEKQFREKPCHPCDLVWFPPVSACVPEHAVLSMRPDSFCYATHLAKRSWANQVTLHFLIISAANALTGEDLGLQHPFNTSFLEVLQRNSKETQFLYFVIFFYCVICLPWDQTTIAGVMAWLEDPWTNITYLYTSHFIYKA